MKSIFNYVFASFLIIQSAYSVTFNLNVNFGGDSLFDANSSAYLVVNSSGSATNTLTTISNFIVDGAGLSTGSVIGDYVVIEDNFTTSDFSGNGEFGFSTVGTNYDTSTINSNIVTGTNLGIVVINGTDVLAYSGATTGDTNVSGDTGWEIPSDASAGSLVDLSTSFGGRVSFPGDMATIGTVGTQIPEPSTALLGLVGLFSLITRRRRLI